MRKSGNITHFLRSRFFLLIGSVLCFTSAFFISGNKNTDYAVASEKFEEVLHKKETYVKKELAEFSVKAAQSSSTELFREKADYYESLFEREGLVFLIFENDTLKFWTDNTVAVDNLRSKNNFNGKIVKLPNGWFLIEKCSLRKKELFALILLRKEFAYQNKYLVNEFQRDFNLNPEVTIKLDLDKVGRKLGDSKDVSNGDVYEKNGDYLCTLVFPFSSLAATPWFYFGIIFNILGIFFAIWFLEHEVDLLENKIGKGWSVIFLSATVVMLRYLTLQIDFPGNFYDTKLFTPELYGDATYVWLKSLGDLLINSVLVLYLAFYTYRNVHSTQSKNAANIKGEDRTISSLRGWEQPFISFLLLLILFLSSGIINYVFSSIISNSNIPFTLNDIFSQNIFTYLALIIMGLLFMSYFLLVDISAGAILALQLKKTHLLLYSLTTILLFIILSHLLGNIDLILVFWPALLFIFITWTKERQFHYSFSVIIILLFIISFFSAHMVLKYTDRKEKGSRQVFAQKFSAEQDPLAEHFFAEIEVPISTDTALINLLRHSHNKDKSLIALSPEKAQNFMRTLISKYLSGYWEKYEIKVSVFDTTCLPLLQGLSPEHNNLNYFENVIASQGTPTESPRLYYLANSTGCISYLARIPLMQFIDSSYRIGDIFIELDSRIVSEEMGFPELMLDRKIGIANELLDYSYAKYKDGKLIVYHGKFSYSFSSDLFLPGDSVKDFPQSYFSNIDGFNHLSYIKDRSTLVVISKKDERRMVAITTFCYLFAFFSLVLLVLLFLRFFVFEKKNQVDSFRSRIQYVLVSMVLFSLLFFGVGTTYYIRQQYEWQTQQSVRDKMFSALVKGMQELGEETELKRTKSDYFSYILKRMSNIFHADISLYDVEGNLMGSSQMKIFDEGLLSRKMSPEPYYRLALKQNIEFINDEKIGNLKYLSAYCSFRNNAGNLLGYLNIPYFARQSELEKEISAILSAIINIYVLLFVISVILALSISEYFTKPLKLIQEKLSKIKLGNANEPIEWKTQDEIGSLVNEYNRMIEELQKSAELLAKSERETAWREMAKQVAHEIKNPLTPMKLSIQHLQRTWMNKDDDRDKKIERITATLIEQIETLSNIAGAFMDFAKMPVTVREKINLRNVIESAISLFKDSANTEITFKFSLEEAFVYADKKQMLRVCNNLLTNALQAIPEDRQGKIDVSLTRKNGMLIIEIKDNGIGINEDKMSKIFLPDFTTKTGGMGLGLAMVKNSVETFNGKIWFNTLMGSGTTFFVSFPEYRD